jgi:serine/threonine protein kinase
MDPTEPLVLSEEVVVFPVTDLDPAVRASIAAQPDEYGVTKRDSRRTTRVVDRAAAELLEEFRAPTSVPEAILRFSRRTGAQTEDVLNGSFGFLSEMVGKGFLVQSAEQLARESGLANVIGEWRVLEPLRLLEDTEVYLVRSASGARGVVKQITPVADRWVRAALNNEASILGELDGVGAPRLLEDGSASEPPYIVVEWRNGLPSHVAAAQVRQPWLPESRRRLGRISLAVIGAYVALHDRAVIHADVQPTNVLVDLEDETASLIDFGLAVGGSHPAPRRAPRGGVPALYPPEYAGAFLAGKPQPPPTTLGEQYSVAALIYKLMTGHDYLESVLDPDAWHRSICTEPPRPFVRIGQPPWPRLEAVLGRALAKDSRDRYPSMTAFRDEFARAARTRVASRGRSTGARWRSPGLFPTVLARLTDPSDIVARPLSRPTASLNYGASGIAYFLYRASCLLDRPDLLAAADLWIERAKREAAQAPEDAFYDERRGLTEPRIGRAALYHSPVGVHFVEGLIASSAAQERRLHEAIDGLVTAGQVAEERADLATGFAGQLIACAALLEALSAAGWNEERERLVALGQRRRDDLLARWTRIDEPVPGAGEAFLGIAHGWAGVAYALLRFAAAAAEPVGEQVREMVSALEDQARMRGGQAWWPLGTRNEEVWTGWCHGSAGYALLWAYAQRSSSNDDLLQLAAMAGEHAWAGELPPVGQLCCGTAGQAHGFLALHRLTGDGVWVDRARQRLEHAVGSVGTPAMIPDSLYKGDLGVALLEVGLSEPFLATMPLFEPEGWPPSR